MGCPKGIETHCDEYSRGPTTPGSVQDPHPTTPHPRSLHAVYPQRSCFPCICPPVSGLKFGLVGKVGRDQSRWTLLLGCASQQGRKLGPMSGRRITRVGYTASAHSLVVPA